MPGGTAWKTSITNEIQAADCVIALVSEASLRSDWCRSEWKTAKDLSDRRGRPHIVPLRLDNSVDIPREFENIQIAP